VRLADNHVAGSMVFNIGSSLYSRLIISHISILCCCINVGNNVLMRFSVVLSINAALSFIDKIVGDSAALITGLRSMSIKANKKTHLLFCIVGLFLGEYIS